MKIIRSSLTNKPVERDMTNVEKAVVAQPFSFPANKIRNVTVFPEQHLKYTIAALGYKLFRAALANKRVALVTSTPTLSTPVITYALNQKSLFESKLGLKVGLSYNSSNIYSSRFNRVSGFNRDVEMYIEKHVTIDMGPFISSHGSITSITLPHGGYISKKQHGEVIRHLNNHYDVVCVYSTISDAFYSMLFSSVTDEEKAFAHDRPHASLLTFKKCLELKKRMFLCHHEHLLSDTFQIHHYDLNHPKCDYYHRMKIPIIKEFNLREYAKSLNKGEQYV